jgi:malate dehydrogenase (oxaloacetate-decarboxylating)
MQHETSTYTIKRTRVKMGNEPILLGRFTMLVAERGARFGEITTVHIGKDHKVRDADIIAPSEAVFDEICDAIREVEGIDLLEVKDVVRETHRGGKIEVVPRVRVNSIDDLQLVYTPGVASVCKQIQANPGLAYELTGIQNSVAIVTNGTAILGLGDIGPVAGMPVMEGKAVLFQLLAGISGYPVLISSKDPGEIVRTVAAIAKTFGAIKLEDIRAPECFEIERQLDEALDIPVVHDDQHGTGVVVLAALLNIARYTHINLRRSILGIIGLGAAGNGIFRLCSAYGVQRVVGTDINETMTRHFVDGGGSPTSLEGVMAEADIVIATTGVPGLIRPASVRAGQVILALSNPDPEIYPDEAIAAGAAFAADGKSVNNALAFPGLFRGALDARATHVNNLMKIAAAEVIASFASEGDLVPNILDREVHAAVARAVKEAALKSGVVKFVSGLD